MKPEDIKKMKAELAKLPEVKPKARDAERVYMHHLIWTGHVYG